MDSAIPAMLVRGGHSTLPPSDTLLELHDILQVSATGEGVKILRERMDDRGAVLLDDLGNGGGKE